MKVLQICAAYKPAYVYGGPTMSVSALSESLKDAGIDCYVFTTTANGAHELSVRPDETVTVDGVTVTYFKRITKDHSHFSPALFRRLRKEVTDYDVVHIHAWWNLVSLLACRIALRCGIPVLVSPRGTLSAYSFHNKSIGLKKIIHLLIGKRLLEQCSLHATTEREKVSLGRFFKPGSIAVLPNFVKLPPCRASLERFDDGILKLLFLSRIEAKKGLDLLLKALPMLNCKYTLTIAGTGEGPYVQQLKSLAEQNGAAANITWLGFVNEEKFELTRAHDLFILPSHDENFGNVVIECLSTGTSVLVSHGVGLADYVKQVKGGWVCANDPVSMSEAIDRIAQSRAELQRIREEVPAQIYRDFDEEALAKQYIDLYQQIAHDGIHRLRVSQ